MITKKNIIGLFIIITISILISISIIKSVEIQVGLFHNNPCAIKVINKQANNGSSYFKQVKYKIIEYNENLKAQAREENLRQKQELDKRYMISDLVNAFKEENYSLVDSLISVGAVAGDRLFVKLCRDKDSLRVAKLIKNCKKHLPSPDYSYTIFEMGKNRWFSLLSDFIDCKPFFRSSIESCFSRYVDPYYYPVLYDNYEALQKLIAVNGTKYDYDITSEIELDTNYPRDYNIVLGNALSAADDEKMIRYLFSIGCYIPIDLLIKFYEESDFSKFQLFYNELNAEIFPTNNKLMIYASNYPDLIDFIHKEFNYEFSYKQYRAFKDRKNSEVSKLIYDRLSEVELNILEKSMNPRKSISQILNDLSDEELLRFQDDYGRNSLIWAIIGNNELSIDELLNSDIDYTEKDIYGRDAIFYSFIHGKQDYLEDFLDKKLSSQIIDKYGRTPLFYTQPKYMKSILKSGCEINHQDFEGRTALMLNNHRYELVKLGADKKIKDSDGYYPFHYNNFNIPFEGKHHGSNFYSVPKPTNKALYHRKINFDILTPSGKLYLHRDFVSIGNLEFAISKGYDINKLNEEGRSILHLNVENLISAIETKALLTKRFPLEKDWFQKLDKIARRIKQINDLIRLGADLDLPDSKGLTSREIIHSKGWKLTDNDIIDTSGYKRDVYDIPFE